MLRRICWVTAGSPNRFYLTAFLLLRPAAVLLIDLLAEVGVGIAFDYQILWERFLRNYRRSQGKRGIHLASGTETEPSEKFLICLREQALPSLFYSQKLLREPPS